MANNLRIEMSLKGAVAKTTYDVYVHIDGPDTLVGTVTTNAQGNANFHWRGSVGPGLREAGLGLQRAAAWQFGTGLLTHSFK